MSERVSLVVLCEDALHETFVTAFLRRMKIATVGELRIRRAGKKDAVLNAFSDEVERLRRSNVQTRLIVVIDADERSDAQVHGLLKRKLQQAGMIERYEDLPILVVLPRWELDNWALHLLGEPIGEGRDRGAKDKLGDRGRDAARRLADHCKDGRLPTPSLPSLDAACREWQAYRERHGS